MYSRGELNYKVLNSNYAVSTFWNFIRVIISFLKFKKIYDTHRHIMRVQRTHTRRQFSLRINVITENNNNNNST